LIDNTVLAIKQDELGNIWLGLDYGIARIELQSAINAVFDRGATYGIRDIGNKTYLATNKGLFCSDGGPFYLLPNTGGQTWKIRKIDNEVYICHNRGLFELKGDVFIPLYGSS